MVEYPRVVFATNVGGNAQVSAEIANMAQRYPLRSGAGTRRLHAAPQIVVVADVVEEVRGKSHEPLLLRRGPLLLLLTTPLFLDPLHAAHRLGPKERIPSSSEVPGVEERLVGPPPVSILAQAVVHKLCEDGSRLVHTSQVGSAEIRLEHEAFYGGH